MKNNNLNKKRDTRLLYCLSGLLALFAITPINAQTIGDVPHPASPSGAALARNVSIPMEYYTGRANIQIPLYQIESRDINIPITLSYQSSGIKVSDLSTWVGLGWDLSTGGKVSRMVHGVPDEKKYLISGNQNSLQYLLEHDPEWSIEKFNKLLDWQNHYVIDGQPDVFYYEILGKSGMFVFDPDGKAHTIPYQDIEIEWVDKNYFIIKDENGNKFTLGLSDNSKELIKQTISDTISKYVFDDEEDVGNQTQTIEYVSSWYLNKVTSPTGDCMTFQYDTTAVYSYNSKNESSAYSLDVQDKLLDDFCRYRQNICTEIKRPVYLNKIQWKGGELKFHHIESISDIPNMRLLRWIEIYADGQNLRNIKFDYTTFDNHALKLTKVYETSSLNIPLRSICSFEYNEAEKMPTRNSQAFDHWGYYNGNKGDTTYFADHINNWDISFTCKNREPDLRYAQASALKAIVYPYGGRKEFEYELNEGLRPDGTLFRGGGLRVKRILEYETAASEKKITRYEYLDSTGTSSGSVYAMPNGYILDKGQIGAYKNYMIYNINVNYISDINGLSTVYRRVKEILPDNSYNIYEFSTCPDIPGSVTNVPTHGVVQDYYFTSDVSGLIPATTQYWKRGLPVRTIQCNASGQIMMEKRYTYQESGAKVDVIPAYYLTQMKVNNSMLDTISDRCLAKYVYVSNPIHLVKKEVVKTPYTLPSITHSLYGNHPLLPSEVVTVDINGDTVRNRFKYAADYFPALPASSADTMVQALKTMQALHMVAVPIEQVLERNGRVFGGEITTYRNGSIDSTIVKYQTKKNIIDRPVLKNQFSLSDFVNGRFICHASYRNMTTADHYDDDNNLIQVHDRYDHYKSSIYGYDNTLPIAVAENARSSNASLDRGNEIFHTSFEEDGAPNYPNSDDAKTGRYVHRGSYSIQLRDFRPGTYTLTYWRQQTQGAPWEFVSKQVAVPVTVGIQGVTTTIGDTDFCIDEVRIFPQGAKMVTMTYDPNVGITSETDHNGITKYYQYDKLGRLIQVRNNDRQLIESYEYKK